MRVLQRLLLRNVLPMFFFSMLFFILVLQLVDVFTYIFRYISLDVSFAQIALVQLYYVPKCVSYSISPSLLFAVAYTLGNMYANNELIAVFGSGVSLIRLVFPVMVFGIITSVGGFFFEERVVIETFSKKNSYSQALLKQRSSLSNTNVTVIGQGNTLIYNAEYYNDSARALRGLIVIERSPEGKIIGRIDAEQAVWKKDRWEFQNARLFSWDENGEFLVEENRNIYTRPDLTQNPDTFKKTVRNLGELKAEEAAVWVQNLQKAGLPYREPLTAYYKRFSFALTPLVVAFLSCALGGRFKKNVLLMSILLSLLTSVLFYVFQMITSLLAKSGMLSPLVGAWTPFILFSLIGLWLFRTAKT